MYKEPDPDEFEGIYDANKKRLYPGDTVVDIDGVTATISLKQEGWYYQSENNVELREPIFKMEKIA